jgi:hypothetical protein
MERQYLKNEINELKKKNEYLIYFLIIIFVYVFMGHNSYKSAPVPNYIIPQSSSIPVAPIAPAVPTFSAPSS